MIRRFAVLAVIFVALAVAAPAMAQEHGEAAGSGDGSPWGLFAPAIAIGLAAAFGSLGQGKGLLDQGGRGIRSKTQRFVQYVESLFSPPEQA